MTEEGLASQQAVSGTRLAQPFCRVVQMPLAFPQSAPPGRLPDSGDGEAVAVFDSRFRAAVRRGPQTDGLESLRPLRDWKMAVVTERVFTSVTLFPS